MSKRVNYMVRQLLINGYKTATPQLLRDNNKILRLAIWEMEGLELTPYQKAVFMQNCSAAGTITRERRKMNKEFPSSPKVKKFRQEKEYQMRKENSPHTPILQGALI